MSANIKESLFIFLFGMCAVLSVQDLAPGLASLAQAQQAAAITAPVLAQTTTQTSQLTSQQILAVAGLLQSFGATSSLIQEVSEVLNGTGTVVPVTPTTGTITMSVSTTPGPQTLMAGSANVTVGNILLDTTNSSENIRVPGLTLMYKNNLAADVSGCVLRAGNTQLVSGSRVVNPNNPSNTSQAYTFTLDNPLVVTKGMVTTLSVTCNVPSNATGSFSWGLGTASITDTGVTTGKVIIPTVIANAGSTMTIATGGKLSIINADPGDGSPNTSIVAGGTTGLLLNAIGFNATNEAVNLQKIGLALGGGKSTDLAQLYMYAGSNLLTTSGTSIAPGTLLGIATFTGNSTTATSTLVMPVQIALNAQASIFIKGDIANVGISQPATPGDLAQVNVTNAQGVGASSGATILATAGGYPTAGVRIFKSFPTFAAGPALAQNPQGLSQPLKRFSITANSSGPIGIQKLSFTLSEASASVSGLKLNAYTDAAYALPANVSGSVAGQFGTTETTISPVFTVTTPLEISAGQTMYFTLYGNVAVSTSTKNWIVSAKLNGDDSYSMLTTANSVAGNFVWSPNDTGTANIANADWTNGQLVSGLSSSGF